MTLLEGAWLAIAALAVIYMGSNVVMAVRDWRLLRQVNDSSVATAWRNVLIQSLRFAASTVMAGVAAVYAARSGPLTGPAEVMVQVLLLVATILMFTISLEIHEGYRATRRRR